MAAQDETRTTDRVLIPLDGSSLARQALPIAQALAPAGSELVLLEVIPDLASIAESLIAAGTEPYAVRAAWERAARERLEDAATGPRDAGLTVRVAVAVGDPAEQIIRIAGERGVALIVLASHGRGAVGRRFYGSVADRVARTAPIPVAVVRPESAEPGPAGLRRLVVPLDGSELAAAALPVARRLGSELGLPIHLVRVADPAAVFDATGEAAFASDVYDAIRDQLRREAEEQLAEVAARLDAPVSVTREVRFGAAAIELLNVAQPGDLVVMTSHGRGGLTRWLLGSVAEKLVRQAAAPVLLVPVGARQLTAEHEPTP